MHKFTHLLIIIFTFFSSEIIAQNLNLKIIGASDIETEIIKSLNYNANPIDYNSILKEVDSTKKKIVKAGYINYNKSTLKKLNDNSFQIKFQLNNKYDAIEIKYKANEIDKKLIAFFTEDVFSNYFIIPFSTVEKTLNLLNKKIANQGYPFSKIKLSEIKIKNENTLTANLVITKKDKKRSLDNIVIKGYNKFPKSFLQRMLKIKPNKTFNIETIKKKMNILNSINFAKQTKAPEILFTKDSTTLYIYLNKLQSNTFDGFIGFNTNETTNKIDFNGYLNLELNNNFNYGETFNLIYKSDESDQKNFEATLNLPYILASPLGTEFSLRILKRDSSFTSVNQKANIFYQLNAKNRIFIGIENEESNNLLDHINFTDYTSNSYNIKYVFENRQNTNSLFRIKSNIEIEVGTGKRRTNNIKEAQEKIKFNMAHNFNLNKKNSIYSRIKGAIINSDTLYENELYRFGGINSIRGFQENSILANRFIILNTEYRYLLSKRIYAHTIFDFSNFENKIANIKENLYGFGLGFGIATKAGLLKFNFANGKTEDQNFKFSNSKIHLSLVTIF